MLSSFLVAAVIASPVHPHLYRTPEDVARARLNVERFAWAKEFLEKTKQNAGKWAAKSDAELRAMVPPPGSKFAYGFSGCPACGTNWTWWGAGGLCSFDKPGIVTCASCKRAFPDADHPDTGPGWKSPKDGKLYYLAAVYNSFAAQQITTSILHDLSLAYALTGDAKYSRAAASLFDRLADTYPSDISGSMDYPSTPPSGRLERPWYQVARVLVLLADDLDLLYDSPEFAAPSAGGKGSVREHVEEAIIRDGGKYCYDETITGKMGLTNGQADYVRGSLAAGLMLGVQDWIDCAVKGPYRLENFLANCLDRDGQDYETALGYSDHAVNLDIDMAEMLINYRTPEYPQGLNLFDHPKLQKALVSALIDTGCFGHAPRFGDWAPDFSVVKSDDTFLPLAYGRSEMLAVMCGDEASRSRWAATRSALCAGDVESKRASRSADGIRDWLVFHAEPVPIAPTRSVAPAEPRPVLGGRGVAIMRSGRGRTGRAVLLRYGPSLNHGHFDDLNVNFYALGRELTYDLGYSLGSAHVQTSWAKQTASHNVVVVNEKRQMLAPGGGGSAQFYVDAAPVRAVEASCEASYLSEGVSDYRRTLAMIDIPGGSYLVDIFRVAGGKQHDLMWHFLGELGKVDGVDLGPVQEKGSLAGPDIEWGTKVGPAGDLIGCADKPPYWTAPPNNGYGFLYNVRRAGGLPVALAATWNLDKSAAERVKLHLLPDPGSELITARAPGILPDFAKADYAILRRTGDSLRSAYVSIVEPCAGESVIRSIRRLDCGASPETGAVGLEIESSAGTDYVFSALQPDPVTFRTGGGEEIRFAGRFGFVRTSGGSAKRAVLVGGTELSIGPIKLSAPEPAFEAKVTGVDDGRFELTLDEKLPPVLEGSLAYLDRPGYSHNSPYRIASASGVKLVFDADFVLGRGQVGDAKPSAPDAIASVVPFPRAVRVNGEPSGYFRGKLISNDRTGKTSTIIDIDKDQRTVHVKDPSLFRAGDPFTIHDVQPGDTVRLPSLVLL